MLNIKTYFLVILLLFTSACSINKEDVENSSFLENNFISIDLQYWNSASKFKVIDGYVEGANVYVDWNFNGIQDENELSAYWTGVTDPYEICIEWDIVNDECGTTYLIDPPDNYYWWIDDTFIPDKSVLDELNMTKEDWLAEAFPDQDGDIEFINTGIQNFTNDCFLKSLKVAEIPVGAFDSNRGTVTKPYKLYLNYGYLFYTFNFSNITPFTSILLKGVGSEEIKSDVIQACDSGWWDKVTPHIDKIETLLDNIYTNLGYDRWYIFDDFIASDDEDKILQAERIVDHLSTIYDIKEIIKINNNLRLIHDRIDNEALFSILSNPDFTSLKFDLLAEEFVEDGWRKRIHFNDLNINHTGQILFNDIPIEINYENISMASSMHSTQNIYSGSTDLYDFELIDSHTKFYNDNLERESENKKSIVYLDHYINQISNDLYHFRRSIDDINFIISINNPLNNLFSYNIDNIVDNQDLILVDDIYQTLINLPLNWSKIEDLKILMMDQDHFTVQKQFDHLTVSYNYSTFLEECFVYVTSTTVVVENDYNESAFNLCNSYFGNL